MSRVVCAACQEEGRDGCIQCGHIPVPSGPYHIRMLDETDTFGRRKIELVVDKPLTTNEAVALGMQLMELTRDEAARWAKRRR